MSNPSTHPSPFFHRIFLLTLLFILANLIAPAQQTTSIVSGDWSEGSTWDTGIPPTHGDSIIIKHSVVCVEASLELYGDTYIRIDSGAMFCMQGYLFLGCYTQTYIHDMLRVGYLGLHGYMRSDGFIWSRDKILADSCGDFRSTGYIKVGDTFDCSRFYYPEGMNPHLPPVIPEPVLPRATSLTVFPSPASDEVNFKLDFPLKIDSKAELMDVTGKVLYTTTLLAQQVQAHWRLGGFPAGIYIIRVTEGDERFEGKVVLLN